MASFTLATLATRSSSFCQSLISQKYLPITSSFRYPVIARAVLFASRIRPSLSSKVTIFSCVLKMARNRFSLSVNAFCTRILSEISRPIPMKCPLDNIFVLSSSSITTPSFLRTFRLLSILAPERSCSNLSGGSPGSSTRISIRLINITSSRA